MFIDSPFSFVLSRFASIGRHHGMALHCALLKSSCRRIDSERYLQVACRPLLRGNPGGCHQRMDAPLSLPTFSPSQSLNSKPVLTRPTHLVIHADAYTELDVIVHDFSYVAVSGLNSSIGVVGNMKYNLALVLEGKSDDELPEVVLGCAYTNQLDLTKAVPW